MSYTLDLRDNYYDRSLANIHIILYSHCLKIWQRKSALGIKLWLTIIIHHRTSPKKHYYWVHQYAALAPHSGDWLHALPISLCGLRLTTMYYVLQPISILDSIYVIFMNAQVTRLPTAGDHMACNVDITLAVQHRTVFSIFSSFTRFFEQAFFSHETAGLSCSGGKRLDGLTLNKL